MTADYTQADWPPPLSETDRTALEIESGIHPDVIAAVQPFTLQDKRDLARIGHTVRNGNTPCLVLPLHSADGETLVHQIRPHNTPEIHGKPAKYLLPPKSRLVLECHPLAREDVQKVTVPLYVTEGAKKAWAGISKGLACVSLIGVDGWQQEQAEGKKAPLPEWYDIPLKDRTVTIVFDQDEKTPTNKRVFFAQLALGKFLRSQGAKVQFIALPLGPNGEKTGLDDFFVRGGTVKELEALAVSELRLTCGTLIEVGNRQLRDKTEDAKNALLAANDPPELFERAGSLVRIHEDEERRARIETLTKDTLKHILGRVADWTRTTGGKDGESKVLDTSPPEEVAKDLLAAPEFHEFPPLSHITNAPVFAPDGSFSETPGYHACARVYFHAAENFSLPDTTPTPERIEAAKTLLLEDLLGDFPFADAASCTHTLAYVLLPFVRALIAGPTPLHLFGAPRSRTGKSLLCEVCTAIFTPQVPINIAPDTEEEMKKNLLSLFLGGPSHIIFDNARRLNFTSLFGAITSDYYQDRKLSVSEQIGFPVRAVWGATANNLPANDELTGRTLWIQLDSQHENPDERQGFRHTDLREWTRTHRQELLAACITLIRSWIAQGRPIYSGKQPPVGGFEAWTRIMGGLLESIGMEGFLDNRHALKERADTDGAAWRGFVEGWLEAHGEKAVTASELVTLAENWFPEKLDGESLRSRSTKLAKMLQQNLDRLYAGKKIVSAGKATTGENKGKAQFRLADPQNGGNIGNMGNLFPYPCEREKEKIDTYIEAGNNVPHVPYVPLTVTLTPTQEATAQDFARRRKQGHDHTRKTHEDHGSDAVNLEKDLWGTRAEVGLPDALQRAGIAAEVPPFVAGRPPSGPDFHIGPTSYDIKAVPSEQLYVCINARKHENPEARPDVYAVCLFTAPNTFQIAYIPAADVDGWDKVEGRSLYYRRKREEVPLLTSLDAFASLEAIL